MNSRNPTGYFGKENSCPGTFSKCYVNGATKWSNTAYKKAVSPYMYDFPTVRFG